MVSEPEPDNERCVNEDVGPPKGVEWIVRSHIGWRGE